jgi:predicted RNA-binding Zn-ribbon protein involved in translation (DUF1610 family)
LRHKQAKQITAYKVGLSAMDPKGDFPCPQCGEKISPDDCTEEAYTILDININNIGLEEVVLRCNKCTSQIHLTGFSTVEQLLETTQKRTRKRQKLYS